MYVRPTTARGALIGTGDFGVPLADPGAVDGPVDMAVITALGEQLAHRMPVFAEGEFTATWNGPYDITPDWNPILGPVEGIAGLHLACGFSGHGFKLAPAVAEMLAKSALGLEAEIDITPYRLGRFADGALLTGAYGPGSIS
jgi:sarcosine oxidase subunit beta